MLRCGGVNIRVEQGDISTFVADVIGLKYADRLYGADRLVVNLLENKIENIKLKMPKKGEYLCVHSDGVVGASYVAFLGVGSLRQFLYRDIAVFFRDLLGYVCNNIAGVQHVAFTVHGPGYGLDEAEVLRSCVSGLIDCIQNDVSVSSLKKVTVVEYDHNRASRLAKVLSEMSFNAPVESGQGTVRPSFSSLSSGIYKSAHHVFVAMPFHQDKEDVYHYGIQSAVHRFGLLCERADMSQYTGDVVAWVKDRISNSVLVVADLSYSKPNVYLEVGYAWGAGKKTILVMDDKSQPEFDVQGQRLIKYSTIKQLEQVLAVELDGVLRGYR